MDTTERLHFTHDGGGNEENGDLLQKIPCMYCYTQCPQPTPPLETPGHSQASLDQSLGSLLLFSGSWCAQGSVCALQESISQSCVSSGSSAAAAAKLLQSFPTVDPIDGSPPGSPVPGILQARTLEWVAISFSNA